MEEERKRGILGIRGAVPVITTHILYRYIFQKVSGVCVFKAVYVYLCFSFR